MNKKALYTLSYGVYFLSAREGEKDNACIINTAVQVANSPARVSVAVIKENLTCSMIEKTGRFNLSAITKEADFALFQRFGMRSGRDGDKFDGFADAERTPNGLYRLSRCSNAWMSLQVVGSMDLGSHVLFIGEVVDADVLSREETCTYDYYRSDIKDKAPSPAGKKGWRCKVCGYVHEDPVLPEDFICPWCKHGTEDFEYFEE